MTILIIDDDAAMRAILTDFLTRRRIPVIADSNGADALARLEREHIDAVVVDKEMAGMNGLEVLRAVRRDRPGLPVILITAFGGPRVAQDALRNGASGYLEKPFRMHQLVAMLRRVGVAGHV
jgi:DNA-binding NtrC family response regulator